MKLDINKTLNFIAFATLLMLAFNISTAFGHGYHADEEININQEDNTLIDQHTHN
tara:strand:+ start:177 stop:341 length:165 start_codon:yes stop_codon:yes gene_type:complete